MLVQMYSQFYKRGSIVLIHKGKYSRCDATACSRMQIQIYSQSMERKQNARGPHKCSYIGYFVAYEEKLL
jgi:hypothetical protein